LTARVTILPSGHEFVCEGHSNLLEAGLRSGLALGYGCSNGNCGECLARITSGKAKKIRHHDYRIGGEEADGFILMCCNTALTDIVLEAPEAASGQEIAEQHITARVKSIRIADDVALVHLKTPRTNRLRFLAGQYLQLGGGNIPTTYQSIGSCPCDDMNLHFQVPLVPGEAFSDHIFQRLGKGDRVDIKGPYGDFVLNEASVQPSVFVAQNTGFSPVRSLIEHAMALETGNGIKLAWVARSKTQRYLDNLCRSWNDAMDEFDYVPVDDGANKAHNSPELIFKQLDIKPEKLHEHDFYIAGSKPLMDACEAFLRENGVPSEQLKLDRKDFD
jgi:CDP-4-dehydro-6-deoxyglucose reductase